MLNQNDPRSPTPAWVWRDVYVFAITRSRMWPDVFTCCDKVKMSKNVFDFLCIVIVKVEIPRDKKSVPTGKKTHKIVGRRV